MTFLSLFSIFCRKSTSATALYILYLFNWLRGTLATAGDRDKEQLYFLFWFFSVKHV